jgi:aspartyl-tRNA(Asn)/glutamyl-tRNA(Gln) amidotransferase subunit C
MYDFEPVFSALTREQIAGIAELARLELTASEIPVYQDSLSRILDFIGALERVATANVVPMAHPLPGLAQRLRPDAVTEADHHEEYQQNATQVAAGLYLVPKVIE